MNRYRVTIWDIAVGEELARSRVHDRFGGNRRRGICPSRKSPNILLFSDPAADAIHGYSDDLDKDVVIYSGEGQVGDQELTHGNRAILMHREEGKTLRLFRVSRGTAIYLGAHEVDPSEPYVWEEGVEPATGATRKVIRFRLRPETA